MVAGILLGSLALGAATLGLAATRAASTDAGAAGAAASLAVKARAVPVATAPESPIPADGRQAQWYHDSLRLAEAHRITRGEGVIVAIIDGGVDATHPKLAGQLLRGAGVGADAAPDGWRDDDPDGHGTAMAGLVVARQDVGNPRVWGVAPGAKVLPISTGSEADAEEVAQSIRLAVDMGADVISMSLGSEDPPSAAERRAVDYALSHDVVVVASAGNTGSGDTRVNSPANIPGVIAVTGSDSRGLFWGGSVQGPEAVLAAPGPGIRTPVPTRVSSDGLDTGGGTSNSAAIVAGVAALVRAAMPELDAANVINRLIRTAVDKGPVGRDPQYGFGVVNPLGALTAELPLVRENPLLSPPTLDSLTEQGGLTPPGDAPAPASGTTDRPGSAEAAPAGESGETATGSEDPSLLAWAAALGLAVSAGILLGVAAHTLVSRARSRRTPDAGSASGREEVAPGATVRPWPPPPPMVPPSPPGAAPRETPPPGAAPPAAAPPAAGSPPRSGPSPKAGQAHRAGGPTAPPSGPYPGRPPSAEWFQRAARKARHSSVRRPATGDGRRPTPAPSAPANPADLRKSSSDGWPTPL